jgi:hypothetical protein
MFESMKTPLLTSAFVAFFAVAVPGKTWGAPAQPGAEKLTVTFVDWQKFTDIKDHYSPTDSGEEGILKELETSLQRDAKYAVPEGNHLSLTFTDIDLAGDFEPGRGPNWDDVRIVKDIYPPRFSFSYTWTDASGRVIKSGKENLVDMAFQMRLSINQSDPLHYEKDMLKDWMDRKLRR